MTFRANSQWSGTKDTRTEEIVVTEVSKGPVEAGGSADYEQRLDIPPLPPSNLSHCSIIDLEYNLNVEACVEGWLVSFFAIRLFYSYYRFYN